MRCQAGGSGCRGTQLASWRTLQDAISDSYPFVDSSSIDGLTADALQWQCQRTSQQIIEEREQFTRSLESAGAAMWASGVAGDWFAEADSRVKAVSKGVNGLLFEHLATITQFGDSESVQFFRRGAPFVGELPACGIGPAVAVPVARPVEELRGRCLDNNVALLGSLREDRFASHLFDAVQADAQLGRMSAPVPVDDVCLRSVRRPHVSQFTRRKRTVSCPSALSTIFRGASLAARSRAVVLGSEPPPSWVV